MAAYRHETRFDKVEFLGELYKRRVSFSTVFPRDFALEVVAQWDRLTSQEPGLLEVAKTSERKKRHVYTDLGIEFGGKTFVAKVYRHKTFSEKIKCNLYYSVAQRNFSTLTFLSQQGVKVPEPAALVILSRRGKVEREVLITRELDRKHERFPELARDVSLMAGEVQRKFLSALAAELARLHINRVYTEDTYKNTFGLFGGGAPSFAERSI